MKCFVVSLIAFLFCASALAEGEPTLDVGLRAQLVVQSFRAKHVETLKALSETERAFELQKAQQAYALGRQFFSKGQYQKAHQQLEIAIRSGADNDNYYYAFAINAYKLKNYRKSLAILNILESSSVDQTELKYYEALNHLYLNEDDVAYQKFIEVRDEKDKDLSPVAAMYAGSIAKKKKNYADARTQFEFILDSSSNPKLDQKAEDAIYEVNRLEQFEAQAQKKWGYYFFTGLLYDGNVLNVAKNNLASSAEAYRLLYGGVLAYKAMFREKSNWLPQVSYTDMYSVDKKLKSDTLIQSTDPQVIEVSAPYRRQVSFFKKPAVWLISPAYQYLFMSFNENGRELVFDSTRVVTSLNTSTFKKWISDYRLEVSKDNSHIKGTHVDDQTAFKYILGTSQTRLLDDVGKKTVSFDLYATQNQSKGDNNIYQKYTLSIGGTRPLSESFLGFARIDLNAQDFSKSSTNRDDKGYSLTLGTYYFINNRSSLNLSTQYTSNDSSVSSYDVDKYIVTAMYVWRGGFF